MKPPAKYKIGDFVLTKNGTKARIEGGPSWYEYRNCWQYWGFDYVLYEHYGSDELGVRLLENFDEKKEFEEYCKAKKEYNLLRLNHE